MESWLWTICASSLTWRSNCSVDLLFSCCMETAICRALNSFPPLAFACPRPESSADGAIRKRTQASLRMTGVQRMSFAGPRNRRQWSTSRAVSTLCSRKRLSLARRPDRSRRSPKLRSFQPCSFIMHLTAGEHFSRQPSGKEGLSASASMSSCAARKASSSSSSWASRDRATSEMAKMDQRASELQTVHQIRVNAPHACARSWRRQL
mmetsp:Transcript_165047/g.401146  ORF Transcript_165047/g.401146 Transcript_165047/m.401146 type:complete len:207 (-) Transcript_165047:343-963(-)